MENYVVNLDEVPVGRIPGREIRDLVNGNNLKSQSISLRITDILPHSITYPGHTHTKCEEIIFVLSGHGEIKIDEDIYPIQPGDAVYLPQGVKHLIRNNGDERMRLACSFNSADMSEDLRNEEGMDF